MGIKDARRHIQHHPKSGYQAYLNLNRLIYGQSKAVFQMLVVSDGYIEICLVSEIVLLCFVMVTVEDRGINVE